MIVTVVKETVPAPMPLEERKKLRLFYRRNKANRYLIQDPYKFDVIYTPEGRPIYGEARKNAL